MNKVISLYYGITEKYELNLMAYKYKRELKT